MELRKIGELLVDARAVHAQDVERALQLQAAAGGRPGSILFRTGAVAEDALLKALSGQLGAPLLGTEVPLPDESRVQQGISGSGIPVDWFIDQRVLLWHEGEDALGWTAQDPLSPLVLQALSVCAGERRLDLYLARRHDLDQYLDFLSRERAMDSLSGGTDKALRELAEEAPIIELVNNILAQAVELVAQESRFQNSRAVFKKKQKI